MYIFYDSSETDISELTDLSKDIHELTDLWIKRVTIEKDPQMIYEIFCHDANLSDTFYRTKENELYIKKYFDNFTKITNLQVIDKKYNIYKVSDDFYFNSAFITWQWDGLDEPILAEMIFIFTNKCISLYSSMLPELYQSLD
jgi:hypothetical protein